MMDLSQFGATPATGNTPSVSPKNAYNSFINNVNMGTVSTNPDNGTSGVLTRFGGSPNVGTGGHIDPNSNQASKDFIKTGAALGSTAANTSVAGNFLNSVPSAIKQTAKNVVTNTGSQIKQAGQGFMQSGQDVTQGANELGTNFLGGAEKIGEGGLRSFASAVQGLFSPVTGTLQTASKGLGDAGADVLGSKTGDVLNNSPQIQKIDEVTNKIQQKVNDYAQKNPGKAQAVQDAVTTLATVLGEPELESQAGALTDTVKSGANSLAENVKSMIPESTSEETIQNNNAETPQNNNSKVSPAEVLKNPHSVDEQEQAADQKRVQMQGDKKVVLPSKYDLAMHKAIQPLIDDGRITGDKEFGTGLIKGDSQIQNISSTNDEITKIGGDTSQALKNSKAIWNSNELKGVANKVEIPDPVKNEPTMARNAASLRRAISSLGDEASKKADGTQDVLQNFDKYVKQNYGENFFGKGRNADPFHSYVFSLRDGLNDWAASKLPEGELPSGESYRDARLRQYNLINAKDEMTAKLTREYPEEVTKFQRIMKAHPALRMGARILGRQLLKLPITMGEGELGITQLERSIAKPK